MQRISGLDGVRALAIAFVVGGHILLHHPAPWLRVVVGGQDGVGLFFILSGFLVTTLLLREHARKQTIDIPHFYFRRAMRILPPLLAYLLVVVGVGLWMRDPVPGRVIASVVFFYHNMIPEGTWMLEHTWSLAVEEQFYLLWPILFVLLLRVSRRTLLFVSVALIAATPVIRIAGHFLEFGWMHQKESYLLVTRMDALLAGTVMACLVGRGGFERAYRRLEAVYWIAPLFLFIISPYLTRTYDYFYEFSVGYTLNALVGSYFILWLSRNEKHLLGRVANWKPIATIGVMSYSIYLWQTMGTHYSNGGFHLLLGLLFIAVMTYLSFALVERPAGIFRARLEKIWFPARASRREVLEASVTSA